MILRELKEKDAPRMLEWMHDISVVEKLQTNFMDKTIDDCVTFINHSRDNNNLHLAIADDDDIYMGTVSLKNINNGAAEFAITVHKEAMGKGFSSWAMKKILMKGFNELNLKYIYWCVAKDNLRAIKFYDKNKYTRVSAEDINITGGYSKEQINDYIWYCELNKMR